VNTLELVNEIISLIGKRGLTLPSEFALLLTTLATIQALGTSVDPQFHFVESVTPFARRIVDEQLTPTAMMQGWASTLRKTAKAVQGLPDNVNRAIKRVADGDLKMTVRPGGYDQVMARVEEAVDRLAFAVVVSAFVLGFSWLLAPRGIPFWLEVIAGFALVCAAGVGIWFFLSIMFRRFRHRRRED
jgi:ubiquinone biosynthesis protein